MPGYGKRKGTKYSKNAATGRRSSAIRVIQKAARARTAAKSRAAVRRPPVYKAISQNFKAIKSLKKQLLGPIQHQTSTFVAPSGHHIVSFSPWIFHVNDPVSGPPGCNVYHRNNVGQVASIGHWTKYEDPDGYNELQGTHVVNPDCFLVGTEFQFEISGFVDNTTVRIDFIRQKTFNTSFWERGSSENYLPYTLEKFTHICGFTPNTINSKTFQIIKTKRVFLNSRGSSSNIDATQDRNTVDATTRNVKTCKVYIPHKRKLKQLDDTRSETAAGISTDMGLFNFTNQNPLANVWCIISTDDATDLVAPLTGDAISCKMIRKCIWRDPVSAAE